jgi:hypothetical protein
MTRAVLWTITIAAIALIAIQMVPVDRSNPPVEQEAPVSDELREVLRRSCYDCHSNETRWPWYAKIAPVSWLVAHDVHEAREEFNFSTWNRLDREKKRKVMHEIWEQVEDGEMPLGKYLLLHSEARLSDDDRSLIRDWTQTRGSPEHDGD